MMQLNKQMHQRRILTQEFSLNTGIKHSIHHPLQEQMNSSAIQLFISRAVRHS